MPAISPPFSVVKAARRGGGGGRCEVNCVRHLSGHLRAKEACPSGARSIISYRRIAKSPLGPIPTGTLAQYGIFQPERDR
jgi:hypothetical protein